MKPIGRQCASGLSLLLSAMRFFTRSSAQGWRGRPSGKPAPTLKKVALGGPAFGAAAWPRLAGGGAFKSAPRAPRCGMFVLRPLSQIPDRSGFPSAVLGVGAVRSGLPSAVLGTPRVGYKGHCAAIGSAAAKTAMRPTSFTALFNSITLFLVPIYL